MHYLSGAAEILPFKSHGRMIRFDYLGIGLFYPSARFD